MPRLWWCCAVVCCRAYITFSWWFEEFHFMSGANMLIVRICVIVFWFIRSINCHSEAIEYHVGCSRCIGTINSQANLIYGWVWVCICHHQCDVMIILDSFYCCFWVVCWLFFQIGVINLLVFDRAWSNRFNGQTKLNASIQSAADHLHLHLYDRSCDHSISSWEDGCIQ